MRKKNKETIIDMEPDKDGVFKPVSQKQIHHIYRPAPVRQKNPLNEFKQGISIGLEILRYFRNGF